MSGKFLRGLRDINLAITAGTYVGDSTTAVSGVAPLYVFFDATGTTSVGTSDPHVDINYEWSFGDSAPGNYAYGTFAGTALASRNSSKGVCAGHVYDAPGTYTVTITAYNGSNYAQKSITVTVTDGSANEWAGFRTILVSTSGNFTCAGLTGTPDTLTSSLVIDAADRFTSTAVDDTVTGNVYTRGPCRVLFRSGETFTIATGVGGSLHNWKSQSGPCYIGTYDDSGVVSGANAILVGQAGNEFSGVLQISAPSVSIQGMQGLVISDLTLDCSALTNSGEGFGIRQWGNMDFSLCRRVTFKSCNSVGFMQSQLTNLPSAGYHIWDGTAVVDCTQTDGQATRTNSLIYIASERAYIAGCEATAQVSSIGGHNVRIQWFNKIVIENNTLKKPGTTQHCLKMHSSEVIAWTASTAMSTTVNYGQGTLRRPFNPVQNGVVAQGVQFPVFRCTTAGTTGGTQPTWNTTPGATTSDNTVVWTCLAYDAITPDDMSWRSDGNGYSSTYAVVRANKFEGYTSPWPIALGALDTDDYTKVKKIMIFENWMDLGTVGSVSSVGIQAWSEDVHIFNNLVNFDNGVTGPQFVFIGARTPPSSTFSASKVRVYNNSFYISATAASTITGVYVDPYATNVIVKNNLLYTPGLGAKTIKVIDDSTADFGQVTKSNNTEEIGGTNTPLTDPKFSGALTAYTGWQITDGTSYTKNTGASVPVWKDYLGNTRATGTMDISASEQA